LVRRKLESGLYSDPGEVIRDALRLMADRDEEHRLKLERLREAIIVGEESPLVDDYDIERLIAEIDEEQQASA
jgi:putative addiction module CopG family antidote